MRPQKYEYRAINHELKVRTKWLKYTDMAIKLEQLTGEFIDASNVASYSKRGYRFKGWNIEERVIDVRCKKGESRTVEKGT